MKKYTNLTWTNLSAQTNKKNLLKNISGTAYASKIHAIMGNTSSGKSTLLNMLSGIVPPNLHTYGEIKLDSSNVPSDFVFFAPLLPTDYIDLRTKVNNFLTYSQLSYLKLIGLEYKSAVKLSELSECELKLVKLISNFDNEILFLDDPFSQLDIQHSLNLIKLIKKITKEKELITIITRNENFEEINQFIDSVTYLNDGNLVFTGEIADLITESQIQTKEDPLNTLIMYHQKNYEPKKEEVNLTNQIKSSKKYTNYSLNLSNIFYLIKNYSINGIKSLNLLTLIFYLSAILIYLSSSIYINDLKDHTLKFIKKKDNFFIFIYLSTFTMAFIILIINLLIVPRIKDSFFKNTIFLQTMYKKGKISLTDQILSSFLISHFIVFLLVTIILIPISFANNYLFLFLLFFYLSFNFFICLFVYFESFLFNYFLSLIYFFIILALLLTVDFSFIPFLEKYQFKLEMIGTFLKSFPYFNLLIYFLSWLYTSFDSKKEFGQLELFRLNWYGRNEMFSFGDKYFYLFVGVIVFYSLFIIFYGFMCVKSKMNLFYRYKLKK